MEEKSITLPGIIRPSLRVARFADYIIEGAIVLCITTLLFYLYYYSWTRERHFTSPLGPVLSYILPAALAGLLLASLRLEPSYRVNLALLLMSMGGLCYAVELVLTFSNFVLSQNAADKV